MKKLRLLALAVVMGATAAYAAGTSAGTQIDNSATLSYTAGGSTQESVTSNTDTFVVDKKIDFVVTNDDGDQVSVLAGAQDQNTTWTLENTGNADQNFTLSSSNLADGSTIYGDADNLDTGTQTIYYSTDGGSSWTLYNSGDKINVAIDTNISVRVASDIPAGQSNNGKVANIQLEATAVKADGTAETATSGADNKNSVDTVLADGVPSPAQGNSAHDGKYSAWGGYIVQTPVLGLTKLSCVYDDPVNGTNNPKRIPGANIMYVLDINNSGSSDATDITLKDTLQNDLDGTTLKSGKDQTAGKVTVDTNVNSCSCNDGQLQSTGTDEDDQDADNQKIEVQGITVNQSQHTCISFTVEIK